MWARFGKKTPSWRPACPGIEGTMWCLLLFSGLCLCLHEYHFIDEPKSWKDARLYCKNRYSALATIDNQADLKLFRAAVGHGYVGKVWFGLNDDRSRWKWSLGYPGFYKPGEYKFARWRQGQPNDTQAYGKVCVVFQQGTWSDLNCESEFPFVCYDNSTNSSPNITQQYVFIDQAKSWLDAKGYCKSNHEDLASVRNDDENSEIRQLVGDDRVVWIGLFRNTWSQWTGDSSSFKNWVQGHPRNVSESCGASVFDSNHTGEWVEAHCEETLPFVCHNMLNVPVFTLEKKQIFHIRMTTYNSTIDLNDPAVHEAILNQVKEKFGATGITKDFKVSLIKTSNGMIFTKTKKKANGVKTDPDPSGIQNSTFLH